MHAQARSLGTVPGARPYGPVESSDRPATQAFYRARQQATIERWTSRLLRRPAGLRSYRDARNRLGAITSRSLGVQSIPLRSIVGSVERCSDYTRGFMPLKDGARARWTRVWQGAVDSKDLPPILVYDVEGEYYVADGHHRVSVARQRGLTRIEAQITEVRSAPEEDQRGVTLPSFAKSMMEI